MDIHDIHELLGGHPKHTFEKPICLKGQDSDVDYAMDMIKTAGKYADAQVKKMIAEFTARQQEISKTLTSNLEIILKEKNLWPTDYNTATDHLMMKNDVLFYARHGE